MSTDINVFIHPKDDPDYNVHKLQDGGIWLNLDKVKVFFLTGMEPNGRELVDSKVVKLIDCLRKVVYDGDPLKLAVSEAIDNGITAKSEEPRDKDYVDDRAIECFRETVAE